ncbi:MAG: LysM peptidoglycan-binding domain-containing protein [Oceanococcus sp.]
MHLWRLFFIVLSVVLFSQQAAAQAGDIFPRPAELEDNVRFWRSVFAEYSQNQVLIHDRENVTIIYKVLDFSDVAPLLSKDELRLHIRKVESAEKETLSNIMLKLADAPETMGLGQDAARIRAKLIARGLFDADNLRSIAQDLRGQSGLQEKTRDAIMRSGRYLPYMEKVFAEAGLPVLLTRLPLVESSFNNAAYSKTGAAGMWQFMPGTARVYMSYDEVGDQRRDPWFSSQAAAKHLSDDYALLQDWPLAVTAYNFGRYGIARGLEESGSTSLVELIEKYDYPRWGFAAKNFYAEFLAAVDVERDALKYFGPLRRDAPDDFEEIETEHYVRYDTLRRISQEQPERFHELNPSFSVAVQRGDLLVPPRKRIRIPVGKAPKFRHAYASLDTAELYSRQKSFFREHRVRAGQNLGAIAQRYGTTVSAIRSANGLRSSHFIRIGQVLKIPPRGGNKASRTSIYTVRSGDTLSSIARRFGTSVGRIQTANGISNPQHLRVGVRLKVPSNKLSSYAWHTIRSGQTVESIARKYGVSVQSIASANDLSNINRIRVGQKLKVPGG